MESRHTRYDLKQMQSLPLQAKIVMTQQRIRQWYEHWDGMVYVSFSGGKDSTVLKHIADGMYDDIPSVFVNTGLEYPEIQKFATSQKNVTVLRPKMRFDQVVKTYGYPAVSKRVSQVIRLAKPGNTRWNLLQGTGVSKTGQKSMFNVSKWKFLTEADFKLSEQCCSVMKKRPFHEYAKETGRKAIVGVMADESLDRMKNWMKTGCNAFNSRNQLSAPLSFWTEQDIIQYIHDYEVPYCPVYGDIVKTQKGYEFTGVHRTGCIFCMFGAHREKSPNRFERLKETHPKQYTYCIGGGEYVDGKWQQNKDGLGLAHVLGTIGVKY